MSGFTEEQRARYKELAKGNWLQSSDDNVGSLFRRMAEENAPDFENCFSGEINFFNAPRRNDLSEIDVACVGVPMDAGAPVRAGARFGPRSFREWSKVRGPVHEVWKTIPFNLCSVADCGDIALPSPHSIDDCLDSIAEAYARFREHGIAPLSVGGVHTLTQGILKGFTGGEPVGLLHFDAHSDTSRGSFQGSENSDCSVFLNAVLDEAIDPERTVQIGIRGALSIYWDFAHQSGMRVIPMHEFFDIGVAGALAEIKQVIGDGRFYLSIDVDGIDSTYLPGTQLPEPFGLTSRELLQILRGLRGMDVIGADLVEICPPHDPGGISANLGAALGFEVLCLLAEAHAARHDRKRETHWR